MVLRQAVALAKPTATPVWLPGQSSAGLPGPWSEKTGHSQGRASVADFHKFQFAPAL